MALLIGCGLGGGLAFGLEIFDTSFRDPEKLEEMLKLDVICSVPHLPLEKEVARQRKWAILGSTFFLVCGVTIFLVMIFLWKHGRIIL